MPVNGWVDTVDLMEPQEFAGYDPEDSGIAFRKSLEQERIWYFLMNPLTGELLEIVYPRGKERLREKGITTTFALIGQFLLLTDEFKIKQVEHCYRFWYWLKYSGINARREHIITCISEKCDMMFPGMYSPEEISEHSLNLTSQIQDNGKNSSIDDREQVKEDPSQIFQLNLEVIREFTECVSLSGDLMEVPGIDLLTKKKLMDRWIQNTYGLIGQFLFFKSEDLSPIQHLDLFWNWLKSIGIHQFRVPSIALSIAEKCEIVFPGIFPPETFLSVSNSLAHLIFSSFLFLLF